MKEFIITRPFISVLLAFLIVAIIMMFFNTKLKKQKGVEVTSKWIVLIEMFFAYFSNIVEETVGETYVEKFTPLAMTMFLSIFIGNAIVLIGFQEAATDIMFPLSWTLFMFLFWNGYGIYKIGIKSFVGGFFSPVWWMFPLEIIGFLTKPLTLMIRMFGNICSGFIMMGIFWSIPAAISGLGGVLSLAFVIPIGAGLSFYFSLFAPFIQATVFTYLVLVNLGLLINEE